MIGSGPTPLPMYERRRALRLSRPWNRLPSLPAIGSGFVVGATLATMLTDEFVFGSVHWLRYALLVCAIGWFVFAGLPLALRTPAQAWRRQRAAERRSRVLFEQIGGALRIARDGTVLAANARLAQLLHRDAATLLGTPFEKLFLDGFSLDAFVEARGAALEARLLRGDGLHFWARLTGSAFFGEQAYVAIADISDERTQRDQLAAYASHDALSGLINRREIERRLEAVLLNTQHADARHTLCYLDVDAFALINDACGHAVGDKALRTVAATLSNELAPPGWVGRLGGDEFVVLFEFVPLDNGVQMAANLAHRLAETFLLSDDRRFALSASVGVVEVNRDTPSVSWLLRSADAACFLAKRDGRNRVRVYQETDRDIARRHDEVEWASRIRIAIAQERLLLYAQRIEAFAAAGQTQSLQYEVLVRLRSETGEILLPGTFLSAAERFSMAVLVDRKVLASTVDFLSAHPVHLQQLDVCHVNVSGQSATSADFRGFAVALLQARPEVAHKLCFELTETAAVDTEQANAFIVAVRALGCRIALDDFGNGLSSFAYLKNLPVDIVKIDGIFVRGADMDALDRAVVASIARVCRSLDKHVIAEGVESRKVRNHLRALGVDAVQGFAIHRPEPIETLLGRETD